MADVWACGTTLWEIFMYGEEILLDNGIGGAMLVRMIESAETCHVFCLD